MFVTYSNGSLIVQIVLKPQNEQLRVSGICSRDVPVAGRERGIVRSGDLGIGKRRMDKIQRR